MSRRRSSFLALLALPLAAAACGGGNDMADDVARGDAADEGGSTTSTSSAPGKGTGTLSVGGTEFTFAAEPCRIAPGDQPSVEAAGTGTSGDKNFTVVVKRSPSKSSVIENFQLIFSSTESIVGTNFVSPPTADTSRVEVEGTKATGTFNFLGTGGRPSGEGTFTLTCEG